MNAVIIALTLLLTTHSAAMGQPYNCDGPFKGGQAPTPKALRKMMNDHKDWLARRAQKEPRGKKANLCEAVLEGVDLHDANLAEANLIRSKLSGANLLRADLRGADLTRATLKGSVLSGAVLEDANLTGSDLTLVQLAPIPGEAGKAELVRSNLSGAVLRNAILSEADFTGAILKEAKLDGADLRWSVLESVDLADADLSEADLTGAHLNPKAGHLPRIASLGTAKNLFKTDSSVDVLGQLREAFKKAGMRKEERAITAAIKRKEMENASTIEHNLNYVLFDLPCEWGNRPGRPLLVLICSILLFSFPYMIVLHKSGQAAIWAMWPAGCIHSDDVRQNPLRVTAEFFLPRLAPAGKRWKKGLRMMVGGLYFSLLSSFHIGWRDLHLGNWISRLQPREYTLRATGWVRTVSAFQSIISIYLLAISILTYFGRPFE